MDSKQVLANRKNPYSSTETKVHRKFSPSVFSPYSETQEQGFSVQGCYSFPRNAQQVAKKGKGRQNTQEYKDAREGHSRIESCMNEPLAKPTLNKINRRKNRLINLQFRGFARGSSVLNHRGIRLI